MSDRKIKQREASARYRASLSPDQLKAQRKKYNSTEKHRVSVREYHRKRRRTDAVFNLRERLRKYGLSVEQYEEMLLGQDNKCAICGNDKPYGKGNWHVDHCHKTKKIRGLLCHFCNLALGNFKDSIEILEKAVLYLQKT